MDFTLCKMTSWQPEVSDVMNIKTTVYCTSMCKWWRSIHFCVYYPFNCVLLGYLDIPSLSILLFALSRHHLTILTNRNCGLSVDRKTGNSFMFGSRVKWPNISNQATLIFSSTLKWQEVSSFLSKSFLFSGGCATSSCFTREIMLIWVT